MATLKPNAQDNVRREAPSGSSCLLGIARRRTFLTFCRLRYRDQIVNHPNNLENTLWLERANKTVMNAVSNEAEDPTK
jgi:hypothetical protein